MLMRIIAIAALACCTVLHLHSQQLTLLHVDTRNQPFFEAEVALSGSLNGLAPLQTSALAISHNFQPVAVQSSECTPPVGPATLVVIVGPKINSTAGPESVYHLRNILHAVNAPSIDYVLCTAEFNWFTRHRLSTGNAQTLLDSVEQVRQRMKELKGIGHPFRYAHSVQRLLAPITGPLYILFYGFDEHTRGPSGPYTQQWARQLFEGIDVRGFILADNLPGGFDILLVDTFGGVSVPHAMTTGADSIRTAHRLAAALNGRCVVRWKAAPACRTEDRVEARHLATGLRDVRTVRRLGTSWDFLRASPATIRLPKLSRRKTVDTSFVVTSVRVGDRIVDITCSDTGLRITPEHSVIGNGVRCHVTGTPTASDGGVARVTVVTQHCSVTVPIILPRHVRNSRASQLRLLSPVDSVMADAYVNVQYDGADDTTLVVVQYSADSGRSWHVVGSGRGGVVRCSIPDISASHVTLALSHPDSTIVPAVDSITLDRRVGAATALDSDPTGRWIAVVDRGSLFLLDAVSLDTVHRRSIANDYFPNAMPLELRFTADGQSIYLSTVDGILRIDIDELRTTWIATPLTVAKNMFFVMNAQTSHVAVASRPADLVVGFLFVVMLDANGTIVVDTTFGMSSFSMHPSLPLCYALTYSGKLLFDLTSNIPTTTIPKTTFVHAPADVAGIHAHPSGTVLAFREHTGFDPAVFRSGGISLRDASSLEMTLAINFTPTLLEPYPDFHKIVGWSDDGGEILTFGRHFRVYETTRRGDFIECVHDEFANPLQMVHIVPRKSLVSIMRPSSYSPPFEILHLAPQTGCEPRIHRIDSGIATTFAAASAVKWHPQGQYVDRLHTETRLGVTRVVLDTVVGIEVWNEFHLPVTRNAPRLVLRPDTLRFPPVLVGHLYDTTVVNILCNEGTAPAVITALDERESWGRGFRTILKLPLRIEPGQCVSLPFSLTPSREGPLTGFLVFESEHSVDTLHLAGIGQPVPLRIVNRVVDWGRVIVRQPRDTMLVGAIQVTGPLRIDSVRVVGDRAFTDKTNWTTPRIPGDSIDLNLTFRPAGRWHHRSELRIWHGGHDAPAVITLVGHGIMGVLAINTPDTLTSACGILDTTTVTFSHIGDGVIRIDEVGLTPPLATAGVAWTSSVSAILDSGDVKSARLRFEPTTDQGHGMIWVAFTGIQGKDTVWSALSAVVTTGAVHALPNFIAAIRPTTSAIIDTSILITYGVPKGGQIVAEVHGDGIQLLGPSVITPADRVGSTTLPLRLTSVANRPARGFIRISSPACQTETLIPVSSGTETEPPRFDSLVLSVGHFRVRAGEQFTLQVTIDIPPLMRSLLPTPLSAAVKVNGTMMLPANAADRALVERNRDVVVVPVSEPMEFIGLLGNDSLAVIEPLVNAPAGIPTRRNMGSITILDLCESEGRTRLFSGTLKAPTIRVTSATTAEVLGAHTVSVFDMVGRNLAADYDISEGIYRINVPRTGIYIIVATSIEGIVTSILVGQ